MNLSANHKKYLYIFIGILSIIIIIILFKKTSTIKSFTKTDFHRIHMTLLNTLERLQRVLNRHNIKYWATFGTLLGSIREGKIISFDDDIDIGVLKKDYFKIINDKDVQKDIEIEGLYTYQRLNAIRVVLHKSNNDYVNNNIFIDIFPFDNKRNKYLQYSWFHRFIEPNHYYHLDELFPLKKGKLNHLEIMIPNKPIQYLERGYGNCSSDKGRCWKKKIKKNKIEDIAHKIEINLQ
tara:strand:- start:4126 stop:4833 length:708 start_codon:yes stop_codon:yes gene_type:complete